MHIMNPYIHSKKEELCFKNAYVINFKIILLKIACEIIIKNKN